MRIALVGLLAACATQPTCDEGQVRTAEGCATYVPDDPVEGEVTPFPNGLTWQWQITGVVDTSHDVQVYDVDLFDLADVNAGLVDTLHDDGRLVVCYFSAGSYEPWRPDADRFPEAAIGRALDGWPDERWVDHTDPTVRQIMADRLDLAVAEGCDGVEPDNITAHDANSGFGLSATEQLDYNRFIADAAHERDLAVAMKNDVEQIGELIAWYDFTVNEECAAFDECDTLAPFVAADKAVLHTEYVDKWDRAQALADEVCGIEPGLSTIIKEWELGPELLACP